MTAAERKALAQVRAIQAAELAEIDRQEAAGNAAYEQQRKEHFMSRNDLADYSREQVRIWNGW